MNLKTTLSLLISMSTTAAIAQPTLTASTSIPTAGSAEVYNQNTTYLAGSEGANQTGDFSTQSFPHVYDYTFLPCNDESFCDPTLGTTIVGHIVSQYYYYKGTSASLSLNGITSGPGSATLINNQDILRFPFTYQNSFVNNYSCTLVGSPGYIRTGIDSVSADGWGVLTLLQELLQTYYV